jgi:hypothetical protein
MEKLIKFYIKGQNKAGVVAHACKPNTGDARAAEVPV